MYEVGGTLLSRDKHRGNRATIVEPGKRTVLILAYEGIEEHRFGPMHKYRVTEVRTIKARRR